MLPSSRRLHESLTDELYNDNGNDDDNDNDNNSNNNNSILLTVFENLYRLTPSCHVGRPSSFNTHLQNMCDVKRLILYL